MEKMIAASEIPTIHPGEVLTRGLALDFDVLRLPYRLSIDRLTKALTSVRGKYRWAEKDGLKLYRSIGLQFSDESNPFLDAVNKAADYEQVPGAAYTRTKMIGPLRFYHRVNQAGDEFKFYFDRLIPLRLLRTRLLTTLPGFEMATAHDDGQSSVRIHVPIETNPDAWIEVSSRRFHLPADGSAYLLNTSRPHRIGNFGKSERTHLVSIIYPRAPHFIHPIAIRNVRQFYEDHYQDGSPLIEAKIKAARTRANGKCLLCRKAGINLYEIPETDIRLHSLCSICIENLCRPIELKSGLEDKAINELRSTISEIFHGNT